MGKLDDKVALITGSGSGIGRAVATLFAEEGARVAVVDCVPEGGNETVSMIQKGGGEAMFIQTDVSKSAEVQHMIDTTVAAYGRIDILHNHAGINSPIGLMADVAEEAWDQVIDTNVKGVFLGIKYAVPVMLKQGGGVIINTASIMGISAQKFMSAYCVSKAAVIMLTKAASADYFDQNIRVNCICPGFIETPMTDQWLPVIDMAKTAPGRPGKAEDIARAALFLASEDASYVSGAALTVDGSYSAEWIVPLKE